MWKKVMILSLAGFGAYMAYKNREKLMQLADDMVNMAKDKMDDMKCSCEE